jgi:hypothetical protein
VQIAPETCRAKYRGIKNTYSLHVVGLSIDQIHTEQYLHFAALKQCDSDFSTVSYDQHNSTKFGGKLTIFITLCITFLILIPCIIDYVEINHILWCYMLVPADFIKPHCGVCF